MTDKNEVLELAGKHGAEIYDVSYYTNVSAGDVVFSQAELLAFAAALEEKYQARIAELVRYARHYRNCSAVTEGGAHSCDCGFDVTIPATHQSADAFVARVRVDGGIEEIEKAILAIDSHIQIAKSPNAGEYTGIFESGMKQVRWMLKDRVAELRNSAAQPEGKEGVK